MTVSPPARLFRDERLENAIEADGYAISPMLDQTEVAELKAAYYALLPETEAGLVIDFTRPDRSILAAVADLLDPIWERHLPEIFQNHVIALATFVTKHPGSDSAMRLHDEPSFVDERRARSKAIWIPLVDTGPHLPNGHLEVLPGSEGLPVGMAGYRTPVQYRPYEHVLVPAMRPLSVQAGHMAVYDSRTLHASAPNLGSERRPAIAAALVPRGEQLIHVVPTGRRGRRVFAVDREFFNAHHPADAAMRFPEEYEVLDEFDDCSVLEPGHVAGLVGSSATPVPVPVLPDDLSTPQPSTMFVSRHMEERHGLTDLHQPPLAMPASPSTLGLGRATCRSLARPLTFPHDRRLVDRIIGLPDLVAQAGPVDLVEVDEFGRAEIDQVASGSTLVVVECPVVNAGIRNSPAALQLDVGLAVELPDSSFTIWNEGPGKLHALVLHPRPVVSIQTNVAGHASLVQEPLPIRARRLLTTALRRSRRR